MGDDIGNIFKSYVTQLALNIMICFNRTINDLRDHLIKKKFFQCFDEIDEKIFVREIDEYAPLVFRSPQKKENRTCIIQVLNRTR